MKRLLIIMLAFTIILFSSCGSGSEEQKDGPADMNKNEQNAGEQNAGKENPGREMRLSNGDTTITLEMK